MAKSRKQRKEAIAKKTSKKTIKKTIRLSTLSLTEAPDITAAPAQMMLSRMSSHGDPIFSLYPGGEDVIAERW